MLMESFSYRFIGFVLCFYFFRVIRPHLFKLQFCYMPDNPISRTHCLVPGMRKFWLVCSLASSGLLFCVPVCLKQSVNEIVLIFYVLFVWSIFFVFAYTRIICDYVLFICQCNGNNSNLMADLLLDIVNSEYAAIFNWLCWWQMAASAIFAKPRSARQVASVALLIGNTNIDGIGETCEDSKYYGAKWFPPYRVVLFI